MILKKVHDIILLSLGDEVLREISNNWQTTRV